VIGSKWRSAADAIDGVKSGMTVAVGHVGAEPTDLTSELWSRHADLRNVTVISGMMLSGYGFLAHPEAFRLKTWFMPGTLLSADKRDVTAEYLPFDWTQTARFLSSAPIDIALIQVSEPDEEGNCSFGISTGQHMPMTQNAKLIIAEVNPAMPRTRGRGLINLSRIGMLVRAEHPLLPFPFRRGDAVDEQVGFRAAELVPDGSTLQFGIGGIPGAMLEALVKLERKDLTIYSQVSDPARALIEAGGCRRDGPKAIVGEVIGSTDLYAWSHENEDLYMVNALETHTLDALSKAKHFVSVNSALEVDLFGQVNSEILGGRQVGAIGGSMDFAIGAQFPGALSIVALRSTTKNGGSRIVDCLPRGPVTVPRSLVQMLVSEHGVADLRNKSVLERARAIAEIAAPEHREDLLRAAAAIQ
jgi:acyl-CoA hydrolase